MEMATRTALYSFYHVEMLTPTLTSIIIVLKKESGAL